MADRVDPYAGYNFSVELDGITRAGFQQCSGLESSQSSGDYREGTDRYLHSRKVSGLNTYSDITLSRGITGDSKLWEWRLLAIKGTPQRHDISITLLDDTGAAKITWNVFDCWPKSWTGPTFNAGADAVGIEQIVLACERFEVDQWS